MDEKDRSAFANRLALALRRLNPPVEGPTELVNATVHLFPEGVTVQTAHKWLTARAMPTSTKIEALATWLDVSPHWLRFGPDSKKRKAAPKPAGKVDLATQRLAERIRQLPTNQRVLLEAIVAEFESS
jgi:hypothetical protein